MSRVLRATVVSAIALSTVGCIQPPAAVDRHTPAEATAATGPVVAWPGAGPGQLYAPGEVRGFELFQGGELIGRSWGRYVGVVDGNHVFETRIELLPPGGEPMRSSGRLVLDDAGELVSGFERSAAAELTFHREGDTITITDGQRSDELGYTPQRYDTAVMSFGALLHEEIMFGLREITEGPMAWRLISLSGAPPTEWEGEMITIPGDDDETYRIETSLGEEVTLAKWRIVEVSIDSASQRFVAMEGTPKWPQWDVKTTTRLTYAPPKDARFQIRELSLVGKPDEPELAAELLVPLGAEDPRPGVLFLGRMAGEDRYGFAGPPPVDLGSHEIHDALAAAGYCVLRFDERGVGRSERGEATYAAQLEDARRAYRTLLVQEQVDPDRIVVIGHGEGGLRALSLGVQYGADIDGIVLLASPGRPYADVIAYQGEQRLAQAPAALRDDARKEQARLLAELRAGRTPPELAAQAPWLREVLALDPATMIGNVKADVFIAQGGKDFEVDPDADPIALQRAAKRNKVAHQLHRYPNLDHLFKAEPDRSTPASYLTDRPVSDTLLTDLLAFLKKTTK